MMSGNIPCAEFLFNAGACPNTVNGGMAEKKAGRAGKGGGARGWTLGCGLSALLCIQMAVIPVVGGDQDRGLPVPVHEAGEQRPVLYYINLSRRPDRQAHMEDQFSRERVREKLEVVRVEAVDGKSHAFSEEELRLFADSDFVQKDMYNVRALMGNQLSHLGVWKQVRESAMPWALVMQDDLVLKTDFLDILMSDILPNVPEDSLVVWLSLQRFASKSVSKGWPLEEAYNPAVFSRARAPFIGIHHGSYPACSMAYILTRRGAVELVDYFEAQGFTNETDHSMRAFLEARHRNYIARLILCTGDPALGSDVFGTFDKPPDAWQEIAELLFQFIVMVHPPGKKAEIKKLLRAKMEQEGHNTKVSPSCLPPAACRRTPI